MIFLLETRYVSLDAGQKRSGRSVGLDAAAGARSQQSQQATMSPRVLISLFAIACVHHAATKPVRRTLNFNMFVLRPQPGAPDRMLLTTDGVSRFGPILEYLVQRVQGLMSVRNPPEYPVEGLPDNWPTSPTLASTVPLADAAENEVDAQETRMPGVVVRPSRTKPGTYEVEIDVMMDDGQPEAKA